MNDFTRIYRVGTKKTWTGKRSYSVYVKVEYKNNVLSLHGVEGPIQSGNCLGSCGQIYDELTDNIIPINGWTIETINRLQTIWKRWHLNDMRAGLPLQELYLRMYREYHNDRIQYPQSLDLLDKVNLKILYGYKYGNAWLHEDVPESILNELKNFPITNKQPAWI